MTTYRRKDFTRWFQEHRRDLQIGRLLDADAEARANEAYGVHATERVKRERAEYAASLRDVDSGAYRISAPPNAR